MRCLVTGGSGFLGSHVADKLTAKGYEVTIYDKKKSPWIKKKQKFVKGNLLDFKKLEKVVRKNKIIFHFAAFLGVDQVADNPLETMETETIGTFNIIQASIKNNVKKIIYASTSGVYGQVDIEHAVNENFRVSPSSEGPHEFE